MIKSRSCNRQLKGSDVKDFPHHYNDNEKVNIQSDLQEKPLTPQGILKGSVSWNKVLFYTTLYHLTYIQCRA